MKIQFDPNLEYQQEAIKSVTDIFEGQEVCTSNFSVPSFDNDGLYNNETELGYGNKLHLLDDEIVENLIEFIQSTNPIVIIDEPQSVDTTSKSKEAIESLNPLCTIRYFGFDVNTLTVMANESYEEFANQLQKEIEDDTGIKFGLIEEHSFADLTLININNEEEYLVLDKSEDLWKHLYDEKYIDDRGKVQDSLKIDLKANSVTLPDGYEAVSPQIISLLKKVAGNLNILMHLVMMWRLLRLRR